MKLIRVPRPIIVLLISAAVALGLVQITTGESLGCHIDPNNSFGWCPEDYD
ncbi:hypothetical protein [Nostoc sp. CENA543]|uniref:hypothetical protein n=1 Tax=Nostoc sp. CENA543 TaxID=1869241 RepID=UPI0012FFD884|nr:hypothetical protein [Nostoc sp. CENA543]